MSHLPKQVPKAAAKKRILNEIEAKILNEQNSDKTIELRKGTKISEHADTVFSCECDTKKCPATITLSTQEYTQVHRKNMHFMVIPSHVRLDIEEVIGSFSNYCVVKKLFPQPRTA